MTNENDADAPDAGEEKPVLEDTIVEEQKESIIQQFSSSQLTYDGPVQLICPGCHTFVETQFSLKNGLLTWALVIVLLICFFPLAWVPLCINSCKDAVHICPKCRYVIGEKKLLNF
uniref:LITAF domain-containing protein n=1 Tax=Plectus sambesii TaxID=2011161 RepID=A0A914VG14_9BILA